MANKLSFSAISSYSICGERYRLSYVDRYKEKFLRASLAFGSSIDDALNSLLVERNLEEAIKVFDKKWAFQYVNGKYASLREHELLVYSNSDMDKDLVIATDEEWTRFDKIKEQKSKKKWDQLPIEDRKFYNRLHWECMKTKGHIILRDYTTKVLPKFVKVEAVQHKAELINSDGDTIVQYLDFVAHLQDGSVVLMDNKTTSLLTYYDDDAPSTSSQLISYYFNNKETFKLTAVGFVAMQKQMIKNKKKTCNKCGFDGSGGRHKSCPQENNDERCGGEWTETIAPECAIKIIVNQVPEAAVDLVLETFDQANNGIKNQVWYKNLSVCKNIYGNPCEFFKICWKKDYSDVIKKEERKDVQR